MAARVMPAASAIRTASAVGAETATISGAADGRGLLHHFDRHPAGQQHHALAGADLLQRQRAGQLVQRIVAADILAQRDDAARRHPQRRSMYRTGFGIDRLQRRDAVDRGRDLARRKRSALSDDCGRANGFRNVIDAAYAANRLVLRCAAAAR